MLDVHDPLLGVSALLPRTEHTTALPPGSTLLLYTDGLVERRGEDIDVSVERLRGHLAELTGPPRWPRRSTRLVRRQVPGDPDDDVVVLAMRVIR